MKKVEWIERMGEEWVDALSDTLRSDYMKKLMNFLSIEYSLQTMYPLNPKEIFSMLRDVPLSKVRVVILIKEPYFTITQLSGSLIAETISKEFIPSYNQIRCTVERELDTLALDFNYTLDHWAKQGVLILPLGLTVRRSQSGSHLLQWRKFIASILSTISKHHPHTLYFLWGKEAKELLPKLKHEFVFLSESPGINTDIRYQWQCSNFKDANTLLEQLYGKEEIITWGDF